VPGERNCAQDSAGTNDRRLILDINFFCFNFCRTRSTYCAKLLQRAHSDEQQTRQATRRTVSDGEGGDGDHGHTRCSAALQRALPSASVAAV
jgi:hypothetical protein